MLSLFLGIILVSVMILNFRSATEFVQNQLYTNAKNTAHSLGLSLSKVADPSDTSTMGTMINAIFDSGYYERIRLIDIDGKIVYERSNDVRVHDVPQWFIQKIHIQNVTVKSDIMIGWNRFGTLEVSGHTGHAYRELYLTLIELIQTFIVIGAVVFTLLYLLLSWSLKALERIKKQAMAIIDNEFIIETKIPFATEFRSVTLAMNATVAKVKDIFDRENETLRRYHELLYKDTETKLYNRRYLTAKLPDYLHGDTSLSSGVYVLFSFNGLGRFKKEFGYETYIHFLTQFSANIEREMGDFYNTLIARLNESDFLVIFPSMNSEDAKAKVDQMMMLTRQNISEIYEQHNEHMDLGCAIGNYSASDTIKSLFSRADHTVTVAKDKGDFTVHIDQDEESTLILGHEEWRHELLQSIQESRMVLAFQSVVEYQQNRMQVLHEEILLRLLDREGTIHSAGYFIPMATNLELMENLDRYTVEKVLSHLKEKFSSSGMAINLSSDFIKKESNREWLRAKLEVFQRESESVLWFEVSNSIAINELVALEALSVMLKTFGYRFGIDHFVLPESGAGYLQRIRPDYLKSNVTYLRDILYDNGTGNARESLNNVAKSLGITIIGINIEDSKQMEELKNLGITRFQGSFVSPVALLK